MVVPCPRLAFHTAKGKRSKASWHNEGMSEQRKQSVAIAGAPAPIGPYSPAVISGDLVYTSGQVGFNPQTGVLVEGGIAAQTEQVLLNLQAVLQSAGCELADVIKTTVFLKDMDDFTVVNEIYAQHLAPEGTVPPARSTVEVARLPRDARIEVEAIARRRAS